MLRERAAQAGVGTRRQPRNCGSRRVTTQEAKKSKGQPRKLIRRNTRTTRRSSERLRLRLSENSPRIQFSPGLSMGVGRGFLAALDFEILSKGLFS